MLKHELQPLVHRQAGKRDQLVAMVAVCRDHGVVGPCGLVERLLALAVLPVDLRPWRRDEDAPVIAEGRGGLRYMRRDGDAEQPQIADYVGNSPVEEDRTGLILC